MEPPLSTFGMIKQQYLRNSHSSFPNFSPGYGSFLPTSEMFASTSINNEFGPFVSRNAYLPVPEENRQTKNLLDTIQGKWNQNQVEPSLAPGTTFSPTHTADLNGNVFGNKLKTDIPQIPAVFDNRSRESPLLVPSNQSFSDILAEFHNGDDDSSAAPANITDVPLGSISHQQFSNSPLSNPGTPSPIQQQASRISMAPAPLNYAMVVKRQQQNIPSSPMEKLECNKKLPTTIDPPPPVSLTMMPSSPIVTLVQQQQQTAPIDNNKENQANKQLRNQAIVNGVNLNSLKFVKPAPQCPKWNKPKHRIEEPHCPFWHPRVICSYYPNCQLTAEVCGYAHPFCGDFCTCDPKKINHYKKIIEFLRKTSSLKPKW